MIDNDFGTYRLPLWGRTIIGICHKIPVNWLTKRLLFILRKPVLLMKQSPIDVTVKNARFRLYPQQNLSDKRLLCTPDQLDGIERLILEECLEKGSSVVDLGANIGGYCLLLAAARTDLKIVAVEADPELAKRFEINALFSGYTGRVKLMNVAVADVAGRLMLQRDPVNRGKNTVVDISSQAEKVEVDAVPLLEILDSNKIERPGAIKLDIEGFEFTVLDSFFSKTAEQRWPLYIQLEQHRKEAYNPAVQLTLQKGYRLLTQTRMNVILSHRDTALAV